MAPGEVDHFIFPSSFAKMDAQLAKACGIRVEAVVDPLFDQVGDSGLPHALLVLAQLLERAEPGKVIALAQFGSGAQALVFRTTDAVGTFRPSRGVHEWIARGVEERRYTKFLAFKGQLQLERGMRGEQDKKRRHDAFAVALAGSLGVDPRPFVVAVMFGASAAFATPVGYQTNTLVYGAGDYRFADFLKVGAPMNLIVGAAVVLTIPIFFPLG